MKILALMLGGTEDISSRPKGYGGVGRTLHALHSKVPDFYVMGDKDLLDVSERKIPISKKNLEKIRNGAPLEDFLKGSFDLLFHCSTKTRVNTKIKQLVWCPGQSEETHPDHNLILLHNAKTQNPIIKNNDPTIIEFVLGTEIPSFEFYSKEEFIFQCSNHYPQINSIQLADICKRNEIKCYFAGPISEGYPLLEYIDNINTFYLGEISEDEKISYLKRAKVFASLYGFPINDPPLAFKQALGYGCSILTTNVPSFSKFIINGFNGTIAYSDKDILDSLKLAIDQFDCYNSSLVYSSDRMAKTFIESVNTI